ncbi:MAG: CHC2 zinc finger domain-containing protein, partial [Chlamydiales bacterium]|nr:CHC2 zinc finger domain-containing protein [Chlamydiales bacterium]
MNIKEINKNLDPYTVLNSIGYEGSQPTQSETEIRDFCPIHKGDNQKSLAINISNKTFYCHNCAASGDLVGLYAKAKGITDFDAAKELDQGFFSGTRPIAANTERMPAGNTGEKK